jgi:hypothetical protein
MKIKFLIVLIAATAALGLDAHYFWLESIEGRGAALVSGHRFPARDALKKIDGTFFLFAPKGVTSCTGKTSPGADEQLVFRSVVEKLYLTPRGWKSELPAGEKPVKIRKSIFIASRCGRGFSSNPQLAGFLEFSLIFEASDPGFLFFLLKGGERTGAVDVYLAGSEKKQAMIGSMTPRGILVENPGKGPWLVFCDVESNGVRYHVSLLIGS